jgi:hypothetical protein
VKEQLAGKVSGRRIGQKVLRLPGGCR